ncbi:MAG TPA: allophanate hydrolase [Burkholderiales bacterium]|nr:allophanate hydrolase [Burkholderiales bacterium]
MPATLARTGPIEEVERAYRRIAGLAGNPVFLHVVPREAALERARWLERLTDAEKKRLPLYGVTFAVKDNIDVSGLATTAACPAFAYTAGKTATAVQRVLDAGGILLGKTNLDQFATGLTGTRSPHGACRNAIDPAYISGGSSSGSAVAVALGVCDFALGTDTAGSGRVPAAFNGIVGLKPTRGLVSAAGVVPACRSLDCVSVFAPDCATAAKVLAVTEGFDAADPYSRRPADPVSFPAGRFRFAVPKPVQLEFFGDAAYAVLYADALRRLESFGGQRLEVDLSPFFAAQELLYAGPWVAERTAEFEAFLAQHADAVHPVTRAILESGRSYSAADAFRAQHRLASLRRETERVWAAADVLVVPGAPTIYRIAEVDANPVELNSRLGIYTNFVNLLDLAAITVPAGFRPDGLPFGLTLVGPAFSDCSLAALGGKFHGEEIAAASDNVRVAVVGAHLSGMPLNGQLTERMGKLVRATRTAEAYRLFALPGQTPPKPGLSRVANGGRGSCIEVEVWEMPARHFGSFVAGIPAPLAIGTVELEDGERVKGFLCEEYAIAGARDITQFGGWRNYMKSL